MATTNGYRTEHDTMGDMKVPAGAYYGASTMRAVLNFPISDLRFGRGFLKALGLIKLASAQVNSELGLLETGLARAIVEAAQEVADGRFDAQFVVDVFQSGSGTSTNMNANEVIARRAVELLSDRGSRRHVHPNDHVNVCQSSNDVVPAAIRIAALLAFSQDLKPAVEGLKDELAAKSREFWPLIKTGRTHLQDATPIRLGQEFLGYAGQLERALRRLDYAAEELQELPLGGTAVGTGVNCDPRFGSLVASKLSALTGLPLRETDNHFQAQSTADAFLACSAALRALALALVKIGNDVRWMGSGPRAGLGELALPEVQPGSSIMPGKVNPVIAESLLQACAKVLGNDAALVVAGQASHFELNMMLPLIAHDLLQSISLLANGCRNFSERCIEGLSATSRGPELVADGLAVATALAPRIGYEAAAAIAKEASSTGESVYEVAQRRTRLSAEELRTVLNPERLVEPGFE